MEVVIFVHSRNFYKKQEEIDEKVSEIIHNKRKITF